jgi:hypothetical protein
MASAGQAGSQGGAVCPPGTAPTKTESGDDGPCAAVTASGGKPGSERTAAAKPVAKPGVNPGATATAPGIARVAAVQPGAQPAAAPERVARPVIAAVPAPAARAGSGAPNTDGGPAQVFAVQGDGVNLFQAGRRNGPGTPEPGQRR